MSSQHKTLAELNNAVEDTDYGFQRQVSHNTNSRYSFAFQKFTHYSTMLFWYFTISKVYCICWLCFCII